MSDQTSDNQGSPQPTHEAARVVIPFDIDITQIEKKVDDLEKRIARLVSQQAQPGPQATAATPQQDQQEASARDRTMLMLTIQQMYYFLQRINNTVELIYAERQQTNG